MSGLTRDHFYSRDYVILSMDLVDLLDGNHNAAILLSRIAWRSGTEGGWWTVTKAEMQAETRLSETKVDSALKVLIEHGFIEWERASSKDSTRRCRPVMGAEAPGGNLPHPVEEETSRTPSSKNSKNTSPTSGGQEVRSTEPEGFAEWWSQYPKKTGKQAALRAWIKATKTTDPSCVQAGLLSQRPALVEAKTRGFCPDPASWLNAGRWDDEITPRQRPLRLQGETIPQYEYRTGVAWVREG